MDEDEIFEALGNFSEFEDDLDDDPTWVPYERDTGLQIPPPQFRLSRFDENEDLEQPFETTTVNENEPRSSQSTSSETSLTNVNEVETSCSSKDSSNRKKNGKKTAKPKNQPIDPTMKFTRRPFPTPTTATNDDHETVFQDDGPQPRVAANPVPRSQESADAQPALPIRLPSEYFAEYFNGEFYEQLSQYTSRYFMQKTGRELKTTPQEMKVFIGINLLMGCIKYPRLNLYWHTKFAFQAITNCMSRDRFYLLRNNMHLVHVNTMPNETKTTNRLWKVQPMIDTVRNHCLALPRDTNKFSIDEQMIPFTGRCPVKQYVRNKPRPVGLKNFVLTTSEGLVLDFEIYQGKTTGLSDTNLGLGPSVILRLSETLPPGSHVFFDRYFSSVPLFTALYEKNLRGTGTIMKNRLKKDTIDLGDVNKLKRGQFEEYTRNDDKVCVTVWMDSGPVVMASNFHGGHPTSEVSRWDVKAKQHIKITCPAVVREYNKSMGGVDICDQLLEYYRTFFKTRKWTVKVIIHLLDMAAVNSWLYYGADCRANNRKRSEIMDLLDFRLALAEILMATQPKRSSQRFSDVEDIYESEVPRKKKCNPIPVADKRLDGYEHFPVAHSIPNAMRCRREGCKGKSRIYCEKCKVYLCLTAEKPCYKLFHTKSNV